MSDEDYSKAVQEFCKPAYEHQLNYYAMIVEKRLRNENPFTSEEKNSWSGQQISANTLIDFEINKNGDLVSSTINRASSSTEADSVSLEHLRRNLMQPLPRFPSSFPDLVPFRVDYSRRGCGTVRQILTLDHFDMDKLSYEDVTASQIQKLMYVDSIYNLTIKLQGDDLLFGIVVSRSGDISQFTFLENEQKYKKLAKLAKETILSCKLTPLPDDFPSEIRIAYSLKCGGHIRNARSALNFDLTGEDFGEIMSRVSTYRD